MKKLAVCCVVAAMTAAVGQQPAVELESIALGFEGSLEGIEKVLEMIRGASSMAADETAAGEAVVLDALEAVRMALARNPQVGMAEQDVFAAQARTGQARSALAPNLKIGVGFTYQENADLGFNDNFLTDLIAPGGAGARDVVRSDRVTLRQVLYAGGSLRAAVEASKYLAESQEWRRMATLDALEFDVKQAYYDCLLAQALVRVAEESVATFERHRRDTQQKLDVGLAGPFELLRAENELGSRQSDAAEAGNRVRLAYANVKRLLSLPQTAAITLKPHIHFVPHAEDPVALTSRALEHRPEITALRQAIEAAKQEVRAVKGRYKPQVAATGEWTNLDGAGRFARDGLSVSVGAEWELFDGGRRKHERLESESRLRNLEHQLRQVEELVEFDVRQTHIQIQNPVAKIERESGNVELAREGQRLAALRFREGVGTQGEVLDADLALTSAETQLVVAFRDYAVAHAAMDRAVGQSWLARGGLGSR
jgi:outer membrane protein